MRIGSILTTQRSDYRSRSSLVAKSVSRLAWLAAAGLIGSTNQAEAQLPWIPLRPQPPACDTLPPGDLSGKLPSDSLFSPRGRKPHAIDSWNCPDGTWTMPHHPTAPSTPSHPSVRFPDPIADPESPTPGTDPPDPPDPPDGPVRSPSDVEPGDAATADPADAPAADDLGTAALSLSSALADASAGRGSFSAAPNMTGDFFGAGVYQFSGVTQVPFSAVLPGFIQNEAPPGSPNALMFFGDFNETQNPLFGLESSGQGFSSQEDGPIDTFALGEPQNPNQFPTSPGPGFIFDGGTAVWLGQGPQNPEFRDGDDWQVDYSYSSQFNADGQPITLAGPDVATRRVKLSENFSPEVRDRFFMNYSYFNNAMGGLGDVNRWVMGMERILYEDMVSIELRQPMAGTLRSRQDIGSPGDRSFELGNLTAIAKAVLFRNHRWIWTSGMGVTAPLADDSRLMRGNETLLRIENQSVHLLPYTAFLYRHDSTNLFQFYTQLDVDVRGNRISGDLNGGPLPLLGQYSEASLIHVDASYHRVLTRNNRNGLVRQAIANAELHYTGSLEDSPVVSGNGITITNLARRFNVVNATFSNHLVLNNNLVVTPGIAVPLRGGTDRQFNFEAILQVNYLR